MEALGELLDQTVVSACQEEPLTHRRLFSCQKGEVVISTSPREKTEGRLVHQSILSSENPSVLLIIA